MYSLFRRNIKTNKNSKLFLRILGDKPSLWKTFLEAAQNKRIWFKKQVKSLKIQKLEQNKIESRDFNRSIKSQSLHERGGGVRTSVGDIVLEKKITSNKMKGSFTSILDSAIRGKSSSQSQLSIDFKETSQGEKIRKLIENNRVFEEKILLRKPILDVYHSFFNCRKERPKSQSFCQKPPIKKEDNEYSIKKTTERLFSSTFYLRNNETKEKFFKNPLKSNEKNENCCKEEKTERMVKVFRLEGETLRKTLDNINWNKEKFQMEIKNFKPDEFFLRKTKHRQFFAMKRERPRAVSAK